jgi:surfeit locus 1 family protein
MRVSTFIVISCIGLVLAALIALGTWQVQRLAWKEALIERVNTQLQGKPRPVVDVLQEASGSDSGIDYRPVTVSGQYVPDRVFFEFTTYKGQSGWNIFNLLRLDDQSHSGSAEFTLINRGFIPYESKSMWSEIAPLPQDIQSISGLLRSPPGKKPGRFMPDNNLSENIYYWRDLASMTLMAKLAPNQVSPWYVDAGIPGQPDLDKQYPIQGTTIVSFSNNHLQYVVTWYGLALALLGVGGYFLYARRGTKI